MSKPFSSLSLDLDNQWSYMKTHGDPGWKDLPSYFDIVVPRFLSVLDQFGWRITVFVVGQDAALSRNHDALKSIIEAGHEIGNHSFHHEPWLHLYTPERIEEEIVRTEEAIHSVTGFVTRGFRGPGYSLSQATLDVLSQREYEYDASTFPTFIGPLARAYYFLTSSFSKDEKARRKALFGSVRDGLRPIRPYEWDLGSHRLLEIPVTTMPAFRLPIHFSYLLYIATYSQSLASAYFRTALKMCRVGRVQPSLLLHPLDFLGGDDVADLKFFPAMGISGEKKLDLMTTFLGQLQRTYEVRSMGEHCRYLLTPGRKKMQTIKYRPQ